MIPPNYTLSLTCQNFQNLICVMRDSKHYGVISLEGEETATVIRKFINPAVYVETSRASAKTSPASAAFKVIKKCVCTTDQDHCPCHPDKMAPKTISVKVSPFSSKSSVKTDSGYGGETILEREDFRLSLTSLTATSCINTCDEEAKRRVFQEWLMKKKKEQLLRQLQQEKMEKMREIERLKKVEQERETFRNWLLSKRKLEEQKRLERERKDEEERIKSARPKHDPEEKQLHLEAWRKRKEREKLGLCVVFFWVFNKIYVLLLHNLEKQLKEKEDELRAAEEKQRRLEESSRAYQEWLKSSKYKPKPLPLSRGIDSNSS